MPAHTLEECSSKSSLCVGGHTGSLINDTVLLWYEVLWGVNGSQGGLAALASVLPSVCLCFATVDVEYPADTAVAQPAAGQSPGASEAWELCFNCPQAIHS